MDDLKDLYSIVKKKFVTVDELRYIANHRFVKDVSYQPTENSGNNFSKYLVRYINSDSDMIYVKK